MTDSATSLVSRQAAPPGVAPFQPVPARPPSDRMEQCHAVAAAGDLIPTCYRGKPGAVLLTWLWADRHLDGDLFTAMQNIYPIQGRPYVGAELRIDQATRSGYDVDVIASTESVCAIDVTDPRGRRKRVIAAMPGVDAPPAEEGMIFVRPAAVDLKKENWQQRPSDMLYALVCRVADRRVVRSGTALIDVAEDFVEPAPVDRLGPLLDDPAVPESPAGNVDQTAEATPAIDVVERARAKGITPVRMLKVARGLGLEVASVADLQADPAACAAVLAWLDSEP